MIEFKCGQCGAAMEAPQSQTGGVEECPCNPSQGESTMKSRRCIVSLITGVLAIGLSVAGVFLFGTHAANAAGDQDGSVQELGSLRAENNLLKATLKSRENQIAALKAELAALKSKGVLEAGRAQPPNGAAQPGQIVYKDKVRTAAWFGQEYKKFGDRIALVDGKFINLGEGRAFSDIQPGYGGKKGVPYLFGGGTPRVGEILQPTGRILQVRNATSVLVDLGGLLYMVEGLDTKELVDGLALPCKTIVYVGTWQYVDRLGAKRTICRFQIPRMLTETEFRSALDSGFELAAYLPVPSAKGAAGSFGVPDQVSIIGGELSVESYRWLVIKRTVVP